MHTMLMDRLKERDLDRAKTTLTTATADEIAVILRILPPTELVLAFRLLDKHLAMEVFDLLTDDEQVRLLRAMTDSEAAAVLADLDADDLARLVDEAPAAVAKRLLAAMSDADRERVGALLAYPAGSAGREANPEYIAVRPHMLVKETLGLISRSRLGPEDVTTVFITENDRTYLGLVSVAELVQADPFTEVGELARLGDIAVPTRSAAAPAARALQRRDLGAIPVVDSERRLVGALTYDDAMDAIDDDTSETVYRKAGMGDPAHATEMLRSERLTSGSIWYRCGCASPS